jgi:adenosyl cobinamide kinase/adenosyl cobinamide phosphate guanylyltransferase
VITLIVGGARSGKSLVAERLAATLPPPITYVSTAVVDPGDVDFAARVETHRSRRLATWPTIDAGRHLAGQLAQIEGTALVDALGTWVAASEGFAVDLDELVEVLSRRRGDTVVVTEEVGLGVHPSTEVGGRFRDALGLVNQTVSEVADRMLLVVAGRVLPLERSPW